MKKSARPSWDEYFLMQAIVASTRSTCRHVRAGSVIVADKRIIGTGYNGAPQGIPNCLEAGCRKENLGREYKTSLGTSLCVGVHAEMNALGHLVSQPNTDFSIYTTIFPCTGCAKNLLAHNYNLKRIVYRREYDSEDLATARYLLNERKIELVQLDLSPESIVSFLFNQQPVDFDSFSKEERARIMNKLKSKSP